MLSDMSEFLSSLPKAGKAISVLRSLRLLPRPASQASSQWRLSSYACA